MERQKDKSIILLLSVSITLLLISTCEKKPSEIPKEHRIPRSVEELTAGMVLIPAGEFMMGSPSSEGYHNEHPRHKVCVDAFYIDKYEVTNRQYKAFLEATGYDGAPDADEGYLEDWEEGIYPQGKGNYPVTWVSWLNARAYAKWAGKRLPTEAEWEYACRAGSSGMFSFGDSETEMKRFWDYVSMGAPEAVGETQPNAWGLYNMHGNVAEYCSDWFGGDYYVKSPLRNPKGPATGKCRVVRGESHDPRSAYRRCASLRGISFDQGFRCAKDVEY